MDIMPTDGIKNEVVEKWEPVLEGIGDDYGRRVTAQLLENQAKAIISEKLQEAVDTGGTQTTVGRLGTFQKFAFPIVRRVYPELTVVLMVELSSRSTTSINSHTEA